MPAMSEYWSQPRRLLKYLITGKNGSLFYLHIVQNAKMSCSHIVEIQQVRGTGFNGV